MTCIEDFQKVDTVFIGAKKYPAAAATDEKKLIAQCLTAG